MTVPRHVLHSRVCWGLKLELGAQPRGKETQGGPYCSLQLPKGGGCQVEFGLLSQLRSDKTRGSELKLYQF